MLKAIHAQESREAVEAKATDTESLGVTSLVHALGLHQSFYDNLLDNFLRPRIAPAELAVATALRHSLPNFS